MGGRLPSILAVSVRNMGAFISISRPAWHRVMALRFDRPYTFLITLANSKLLLPSFLHTTTSLDCSAPGSCLTFTCNIHSSSGAATDRYIPGNIRNDSLLPITYTLLQKKHKFSKAFIPHTTSTVPCNQCIIKGKRVSPSRLQVRLLSCALFPTVSGHVTLGH